MWAEAGTRSRLVPFKASGARDAFIRAHAKKNIHRTGSINDPLYKPGYRQDFETLRAPAEMNGGRGIASAKKINPECVIYVWRNDLTVNRQFIALRCFGHPFHFSLNVRRH